MTDRNGGQKCPSKDKVFQRLWEVYSEFKSTTSLASRSDRFTVGLPRCNCPFYFNSFFSPVELLSDFLFSQPPTVLINLNAMCQPPSSVFLNTVLLLSFLHAKIFSFAFTPCYPLRLSGIIALLEDGMIKIKKDKVSVEKVL